MRGVVLVAISLLTSCALAQGSSDDASGGLPPPGAGIRESSSPAPCAKPIGGPNLDSWEPCAGGTMKFWIRTCEQLPVWLSVIDASGSEVLTLLLQASGDIALGEFRAPERPGLYGLVAAAGDPEGTQGRVTSSAIKVLDCPRSSP